ncbi:hypothetical protein TNCV_1794751 [Trichonephila clavipes]|nr:hypothetical protein TNCV_1794751 [Trichonephila clavipes]
MESALKDKTPSELFEQFYSSEAYDLNAKETMRYAADSDAETLVKEREIYGMPRNCFQKLKSYLHLVDNGTINQHVQDRSFKVKHLSAILNNNFMKFGGENASQVAEIANDIYGGYTVTANYVQF